MRILHVIESLKHGGAEQVLLNVLPELQARGVACEVATLWPPYKPPGAHSARSRSIQPDLEARGVRVRRLAWSYARRWDLLGGAARVAALARRSGCDVVHAHLLFADFYVGLSRPLASGPARVASLQNTDFDFLGSSPRGRVAARLLPEVLRRGFDAVAAVGTPVAEHFERHVPGLRPAVIFNAVPVGPLLHADRTAVLNRHGARAEPFTILVAARLAPEKNHRALLEALELLRTRGREPQVLVAGVGALRGELEAAAKEKKLGAQVIFCGHVAHGELAPLMATVDAFVLPSSHEGLPLALAEAMAARRPVVATRVGGVPDLVRDGETGLLVAPGDAAALAAAIERLMGSAELRERLAEAARAHVEASFGARAVAAQWEDFYREVLEQQLSKPSR